MNIHVDKLIDNHYNDEKKIEVLRLTSKPNYEYKALAIGLGNLVELSPQEISKFYEAPLDFLGELDVLIAKIIVTLEQHLNRPLKEEYFTHVKLDHGDSEFKFLAKVIEEFLSGH